MSDLRRLAAGVMCAGFDGVRVGGDLEALLRDLPPAGAILFGGNIESVAQTRELTGALRGIDPELIIAIDQEGGRVARIRAGVEEIPSMLAIGAANDPELAEAAGTQVAFDLRRAGVNLDFAPVLDLTLFRLNTVIGTRAFGDDPERVAELAGAFARGLEAGGVVPTLKHFPGHGSTAVDSHLDLPAIDLDEATLRARDLIPFAKLLPNAPAVMTAHIVARAFDRDRPATISYRILTELLRDELHFAGVCFTDCLQMDAIAKGVGSERAAVEALAAGADCVLISRDLELTKRVALAIARAVETGQLSRERLEEAHGRVSRLRSQLRSPLPLDAAAPFAGIGETIGRRAVTLLRGEAHADASACVVVSFESPTVEGVQGKHEHHAALAEFVAIEEIRLPLEPETPSVESVLERTRGKRPIVLMRRAHVYPKQRLAVERILDAHRDAMLVSLREPFDAFDFPQASTVLCTYGDDRPSLAGLAAVLFDGAPAQGVFPLHGVPVAGS
ncbi:MAG TPA: beta-N-acetylhexosaminidase [Candidatus Rubrimentiphilum sp.]|nr:beta-N-acetylhexosaminidase [Candidatus Rubrimentiphilum sp.]